MGDYGDYGGGGGGDFGSYGGGGDGGGGGGYMQQSNNNFGQSQSSQGHGGDVAAKLATLTPVTIRMIATAEQGPGDTFIVDGKDVSRVTFCGKVLDVEAKATNTIYVIDDGSAAIEVNKWSDMDTGGSILNTSAVSIGNYVCVEGQIRFFSNKCQVSAGNLRVLHDMNEFTHHLLEVISVHVQGTKGPLNPALRQAPQQQQQLQVTNYLVWSA
jgi:replication factor A2